MSFVYWVFAAAVFLINGIVFNLTGASDIKIGTTSVLFFVCLGVADIIFAIERGRK